MIVFCTNSCFSLLGSQYQGIDAREVLSSVERLDATGNKLTLPRPIHQSHHQLEGRVNGLHEMGCTTLGPALYLSVKLAGRVPGSRVVLCTDGCANEGLGNIVGRSHIRGMMGADFYPFVGEMAKKLGVVVNILTFKGCWQKRIFYREISIINPLFSISIP